MGYYVRIDETWNHQSPGKKNVSNNILKMFNAIKKGDNQY